MNTVELSYIIVHCLKELVFRGCLVGLLSIPTGNGRKERNLINHFHPALFLLLMPFHWVSKTISDMLAPSVQSRAWEQGLKRRKINRNGQLCSVRTSPPCEINCQKCPFPPPPLNPRTTKPYKHFAPEAKMQHLTRMVWRQHNIARTWHLEVPAVKGTKTMLRFSLPSLMRKWHRKISSLESVASDLVSQLLKPWQR